MNRFPRPAAVWALARVQWTLALRLPRGTVSEKALTWAVAGPVLAVVAAAFVWAGFRAAGQLVEEPVYFQYFLMGFAGFMLGVYLLVLPSARAVGGFDLGRLFHLPLRPGEILASLLLGNALSPTLILLPAALFSGCVAGCVAGGRMVLALAALCGGALWLLQFALILSVLDFLLLWLGRWRWFNRILVAALLLTFLSVGALMEVVGGEAAPLWRSLFQAAIRAVPVLVYAPGLSPVTWVAGQGAWWAILAVALLETAVLYGLGVRLLAHLMTGGAVEDRPASIQSSAGVFGTGLRRGTPWPILAKDARILWREPGFKVLLFALTLMVVVFPRLAAESHPDAVLDLLRQSAPFFAIWVLGTLCFNTLGYEGSGLHLLLCSPEPRWRVLLSKNLALLGSVLMVLAVGEGVRIAEGSQWTTVLADTLFAATLSMLYVGGGNLPSVLWPFPASLSGKAAGGRISPVRIFVISVAQVVFMLLVLVVAVPLFSGWYALSTFERAGPLFWALAAFMLAYAGTAYALLLTWAGLLMSAREPEIFEKLVRQAG